MRERDETSVSSRANKKQSVSLEERKTDTKCASTNATSFSSRADKKLVVRSKERETDAKCANATKRLVRVGRTKNN